MHPDWPQTFPAARALQVELRERLVLHPPADFAPRLIAGADVSMERFGRVGHAGVVVLDADSLAAVDQATAALEVSFPYVPGYLSFRELPPLHQAWTGLGTRPQVVVFDGHGIAHPRRFGLACYGGLLWGVPSIGCAKNLLVGEHERLGEERGEQALIVHQGEVVGAALRTRAGVRPLYVSPGHLMDLPTAVRIVLQLTPRFREPETTRRAHALVNALRRADATR